MTIDLNPLDVFYNDNPTVKGLGHDVAGGAQAISHPLGTKKNPSPLGSTVNTVKSVASGVGDVTTFLTSTENWIRIGEVIAGLILLVMGLKTLSGNQTSVIGTAARAARV